MDIGSNTIRLLVADVGDGRLVEVGGAKAYTRLDDLADTVAGQVATARAAGAQRLRVVATAGIRAAADAAVLTGAIHARAGVSVDVLSGSQEASLAFAGATFAYRDGGRIAVVDVGGGSTELAVGTRSGGVEWWVSLPVGSKCPEGVGDLAALRPPPVDAALAVGGSATSTARLVGPRIDAASAQAALRVLADGGGGDLDPERVLLLPAGLEILVAVSELLGRPLSIAAGGLREGVCLQLAGFTPAG